MPDAPRLMTLGTAARLAGYSDRTFRVRFVEPGRVGTEQPGLRVCILTASLAQALGREITVDDIAAASRKLDPHRNRSREYQQRLRDGRRISTAR